VTSNLLHWWVGTWTSHLPSHQFWSFQGLYYTVRAGTERTTDRQTGKNTTETVVFCYLQASSSSRCFRPKTARCLCVFMFLCVFLFFLAYITFIIFYLLHDDVTSSAINPHLHLTDKETDRQTGWNTVHNLLSYSGNVNTSKKHKMPKLTVPRLHRRQSVSWETSWTNHVLVHWPIEVDSSQLSTPTHCQPSHQLTLRQNFTAQLNRCCQPHENAQNIH